MRCVVFHILLSLFHVFCKGKKVSVITRVFRNTVFPSSIRNLEKILPLLSLLLLRRYQAGVPL